MGSVPSPGQPAALQQGEFIGSQPANVVSFRTLLAELPSSLYIQRDDQIDIKGLSSIGAGDTVTVSYRLLLPTGVIVVGQQSFAVQSGILKETVITLAEGFLLSLTAIAASAVLRGQTYVQASLKRPAGAASTQMQVLFADYITQIFTAGWPGGRSISSIEGPGAITVRTPANPGAGNNFSISIAPSVISKVRSLSCLFTTGAAVANRIFTIKILDVSGNIVATCEPNQVVTASSTVRVTLSTTVVSAAANVPDVIVALPADQWAVSSGSVTSAVTNIQAADTITGIAMQSEDFVEF